MICVSCYLLCFEDVKNPNDTQIDEMKDWMGTDHSKFSDFQNWSRPMGLADDALDHVPGQHFSKSSRPTNGEEKDSKESHAADEPAAKKKARVS